MPQVSPVFSVDPAARRVYHDNSLCAERYHIEPRDKHPGTGGRPRVRGVRGAQPAGEVAAGRGPVARLAR